MSYLGTVENGVVVVPPEAHLADGANVRVEPVEDSVPTLKERHDLQFAICA